MASTKKLLICTFIILAIALVAGLFPVHGESEIYDTVVRLHVLANSDSNEDQALKLTVRDAVLEEAERLLKRTENRGEAEGLLRGQLLELEQLANETVRNAGYEYPVTVKLEEVEFPTRTYEGFSLPAGEYLALRVLIGEAAGRNWWCVVFPPLCTVAAAEFPEIAENAGFSDAEIALVTEETVGYVVKFKLLEWIQQCR